MLQRLTVLTLALAAAAGLGACGSSGRTAKTSGSALAFAKCMRAHGVPNFPDPGGASGGGTGVKIQSQGPGPGAPLSNQTVTVNGVPVSGPALQAAMRACQGKLPGGGPSPQKIAQIRAQALAQARCMRAHGVPDFPDPTFRRGPGGRLGIAFALGVSQAEADSPTFQAAQRICMKGFGIAAQKAG